MSLGHGLNIVRDSLGLFVDFANPKSISGTTLTDLSKNKLPVVLTNPDATGTMNILPGYAEFIPTSQNASAHTFYSISGSYFDSIKTELTLETAIYPYSNYGNTQVCRPVSPRISESGQPLGFAVGEGNFGHETQLLIGWRTNTFSTTLSGMNRWIYVTQTVSVLNNALRTYLNGTFVYERLLEGSSPMTFNGVLIGRGYYGGIQNYNGRVGMMKLYTRALNQTEISQNFHAIKSRYGL